MNEVRVNARAREEIEEIGEAIATWIIDNVIGPEPISFEMYQRACALFLGCRPDQVKTVYHSLKDEDRNSLVVEIFLDRSLEVITVVGEIH